MLYRMPLESWRFGSFCQIAIWPDLLVLCRGIYPLQYGLTLTSVVRDVLHPRKGFRAKDVTLEWFVFEISRVYILLIVGVDIDKRLAKNQQGYLNDPVGGVAGSV